jgi:two-component system nitrogen regulation response regulator GlnG
MGALQGSVVQATIAKLGRTGLARKARAIDRVWTEIEAALDTLDLPFDRVRLYQDGLPVCGRETEIVTDLAQAGSRNHQLLLRLMAQGAILMGTESADLLVQEYQAAKQSWATQPIKIDVRLISASNQSLQDLAESGQMREDLFFRLNEFIITIPPLRKRKDDIPYLAKRFMDITNKELRKNVQRFSEYSLEALLSYNWPGNVRQLRSVIRRAVLLADDIITERHLDIKRTPVPGLAFTPRIEGTPWQELSLKEIVHRSVATVEREVLLQALKYTKGNKAKAARLLQIDYKTIHTKMKQFGITRSGGSHD